MTILDRELEGDRVSRAGWRRVPESSNTLVDLLRQRALDRPEGVACAFLNDGGGEAERLYLCRAGSRGEADRGGAAGVGVAGGSRTVALPGGARLPQGVLRLPVCGCDRDPGTASRGKPAETDLAPIAGDRRRRRSFGHDLQSDDSVSRGRLRARISPDLRRLRTSTSRRSPPTAPIAGKSPRSPPTTWPISSTRRVPRRAPRAS